LVFVKDGKKKVQKKEKREIDRTIGASGGKKSKSTQPENETETKNARRRKARKTKKAANSKNEGGRPAVWEKDRAEKRRRSAISESEQIKEKVKKTPERRKKSLRESGEKV